MKKIIRKIAAAACVVAFLAAVSACVLAHDAPPLAAFAASASAEPISALATPAPAIDLTAFVNAVLALCAALITTRLIPWINKKYETLNTETIEFWTGVAVTAAEQYFGTGAGQEKKQYVMDLLAEKGFTVDDALIEATVNTYFGKSGAAATVEADAVGTSGELAEAGAGAGERVAVDEKGVG